MAERDASLKCKRDVAEGAGLCHHLLLAGLLLGEDNPAHLKNTLEALAALDGVLMEARHEAVLDLVLNALPAAAKGSDLGALVESCLVCSKGRVGALLLNADEVAESEVLAHHGESSCGGIDVAGLVDVALVGVAQESLEPLGCGLLACDEALGLENAGRRVDVAGEGVDGDDVLRFVVPWAILLPVGRGNLVPRVVEGDGVGEDLHCDSDVESERLEFGVKEGEERRVKEGRVKSRGRCDSFFVFPWPLVVISTAYQKGAQVRMSLVELCVRGVGSKVM